MAPYSRNFRGTGVYQTKVHVVNDLRQHLIDVWAGVEQSVIDDATA